MTKIRNYKSLLAVGAVLVLTPVLSLTQTAKPGTCPTAVGCMQAADGGSTAEYLIALGACCLGGIFLRARLKRLRTS
jgi:hypothetical protein